MKKLHYFVAAFFISSSLFSKDLILLDKIETVIYGPEETSIITRSDLDRPGLDGMPRTKESVTLEHLIFQDAKKYNILDEKLVDRYIAAIQREHNLTLDDLKKMFRDSGYTYEEGREQLAMMNTINSLIDYKIRSRVIVPEKEVRAYYDDHPVYEGEQYKIQRIFVPLAGQSKEQVLKSINRDIKKGKKIVGAEYKTPYWDNKEDLNPFITDLEVGEFTSPLDTNNGVEIFTLLEKKEKRLVPVEERYKEIADNLREPLYNQLFEDYKKSLFAESVIADL